MFILILDFSNLRTIRLHLCKIYIQQFVKMTMTNAYRLFFHKLHILKISENIHHNLSDTIFKMDFVQNIDFSLLPRIAIFY